MTLRHIARPGRRRHLLDSPDDTTDDTPVDVGSTVRLERLEVLLDLDRALCDAANRYSLAAQIVHRRGLHSPGYF